MGKQFDCTINVYIWPCTCSQCVYTSFWIFNYHVQSHVDIIYVCVFLFCWWRRLAFQDICCLQFCVYDIFRGRILPKKTIAHFPSKNREWIEQTRARSTKEWRERGREIHNVVKKELAFGNCLLNECGIVMGLILIWFQIWQMDRIHFGFSRSICIRVEKHLFSLVEMKGKRRREKNMKWNRNEI